MSKFLAGLVRKSAGLPSPVAVRPAISPQQVPSAVDRPAQEGVLSIAAGGSSGVVAPIEQPAPKLSPSRGLDLERVLSAIELSRTIPPKQRSFAPHSDGVHGVAPEPAPVASNIDRDQKPGPIRASAPVRVIADANATSMEQSAVVALGAVSPSLATRPRPGLPRQEPASALLPIKILPRTEAPIAIPAAPKRVPNAFKQEQAEEQRSIHVRIGRVEIRSTQPAPPAGASRKQTTSGFADLAAARSYRDRSGW